MLQSNVDKIKGLLQKSYTALPMSMDLPRLANIRIFHEGKEIPITSTEPQPTTLDKLFYIFTTLTEILVSKDEAATVAAHFQEYLAEATSASGTISKNQVGDFLMAIGGDESPVVASLKPVNQVSISPAIIELKTALGLENMTKDVRNSWFFTITISPHDIVVQSKKRDQCIKNNFQMEWVLSFTLDRTPGLPCSEVKLFVEDLVFSQDCLKSKIDKKEDVKRILKKYTADDVLEASDSKVWDNTASATPVVIAISSSTPIPSPAQSHGTPRTLSASTPTPSHAHPATTIVSSPQTQHQFPLPASAPKSKQYSNGDSYSGDVDKYGIRHGKGTYTCASGEVYEGEYKNGLKSGHGVYTFKSGAKYEGTFEAGAVSRGTYTFPNGDSFTGDFKNNAFDGNGKYTCSSGEAYAGSFKAGRRVGKGVLTVEHDQYDGEFQNDQMDGTGKYTFANGDTYLGSFKDGKFHGHGEYRFTNSGKTVIGEFLDGNLVKVISVE